jgi:hypothetical protein
MSMCAALELAPFALCELPFCNRPTGTVRVGVALVRIANRPRLCGNCALHGPGIGRGLREY